MYGMCSECSNISNDLFMGLCEECWDEVTEELRLGLQPIERDRTFDDEQNQSDGENR